MADIFIRHVESRDADALRKINTHPDIYGNTLQLPHPSEDMWQERVQKTQNIRQLVACIEDKVVGHLVLETMDNPRRSHVATFGISVASEYRGQGVGSTLIREMISLCDNWLRIDRIELTVFTDNSSGIALYERFGFIIEGKAAKFAFRNGEYVDIYYMARLRQ